MGDRQADYVFLTISPQSLYRSLVRITVRTCLKDSGTYALSLPNRLKVLDVDVKSQLPSSWRIVEDSDKTVVELRAEQGGEIVSNLLVIGAIEDSGWDLYPLVSGHVDLEMTLDPYRSLRLRLVFPKGCRGYVHYSCVKIGGLTYDFSPEAGEVGRSLDHEVTGMRELEISYALVEKKGSPDPIPIRVESYFRQAFISLAGSFLLPFLVGFPIILVWGFPGLEPITRLTFTLSAVPLVFSMWYRTLSSGIQDILSLMDGVYAFLVIVWAGYAAFFQISGASVGLPAFVPYFCVIFYSIIILFRFRTHPFKYKAVDPKLKSIPRVLKLYRWVVRGIVRILDWVYYRRRFRWA